MTTTITVMAQGPKAMKVEVQGRDKFGRFREVNEVIIRPGSFHNFILHKDQSIQVLEIDDADAGIAPKEGA